MGSITFNATLVKRGPGVGVLLDDQQVAAVGEGAKRFPVAATVNGHTWRTTVVRMRGESIFGLSKEVRADADVEAGDTVEVKLGLDQAERVVEVPPALADALAGDAEASGAFHRLAYTHRKEYARWIEEAKREDTRERRVGKAVEMLRTGQTRS
jgi:Bacteriocin-protection, YdeI or OmpD-Associated/Domain of unknown function (DUF1905)